MGNNAYIVNSRARVDLTIGIGALFIGQQCLFDTCQRVNQYQVDNMGWWQMVNGCCHHGKVINWLCLCNWQRVVIRASGCRFCMVIEWVSTPWVCAPYFHPRPKEKWFLLCCGCVGAVEGFWRFPSNPAVPMLSVLDECETSRMDADWQPGKTGTLPFLQAIGFASFYFPFGIRRFCVVCVIFTLDSQVR